VFARGPVRRRFRELHAWRHAQTGRDSPKAGEWCAPKCVPDDSRSSSAPPLPEQGLSGVLPAPARRAVG
jgi:hypothetical protein